MMMEYTEKSALPLIESTYEDLTATEKQVADYFLDCLLYTSDAADE